MFVHFVHLHSTQAPELPSGSGGFLAYGSVRRVLLCSVGLTVLASAGVLIGLQAAVGFSWLDVARFIVRLIAALAPDNIF